MPRNSAPSTIASDIHHVELHVATTWQDEAAGLARVPCMSAQAHACELSEPLFYCQIANSGLV